MGQSKFNKLKIFEKKKLFSILESVIKRRLLIDGDGTGDDRRLNVLLKSFIKWSNTKDTPENT